MTLDQIICGDNVEVLSTLPDECINLVVTSPPYDDLRTYGGHSWDFTGVARELARVLKPGGVIVWVVADATVNGSETLTSMRQAIHFKDVCGLNVHDTMIYEKAGTGACGSNLAYWQTWEYAFVLCKGKPASVNRLKVQNLSAGEKTTPRTVMKGNRDSGRVRTVEDEGVRANIWRYNVNKHGMENTGHPAPFPIALAKDHVASWSKPGDVILDPFAGSGTTLKAAKELNRHWLGIEVNPAYVEICHKRLAQDVLKLEDVK
jgi:site-specific DNA-methyltransferase (adenine-specific)